MAKHIDTDILAILRLFEKAGELSARKSVRDIKEYPERMVSRLVRFRFDRGEYYILFDATAGDDDTIVLEHIRQDEPSAEGSLVRNPLEDSAKAYGMPYKGKDVYLFMVSSSKHRLDQELVRRYGGYSRSTIQKYIKAGYVSVNGHVVVQPRAEVTVLDDLALTVPDKQTYESHELPIIYIDDNVIVVNKPAGILTHSKGVLSDEFTVAEFFRKYTSFGLETNRPGIVHRLDRDTSGIIIGARNEETAAMLKQQFADRTTKKTYRAVVDGIPKQYEAVVDLPIGRNPSKPSTFRIDPSGKSAQTTYRVVKAGERRALIELTPKTGRTHQLRVHMQYIHTPIHGDRVYEGKSADRLYLHAESLEITIPDSLRKTFHAPTPPSFEEIV